MSTTTEEAVNSHARLIADRARLREALVMAEYCLDFANEEIVTAEDKHRALSAARAALKSTE